MNGVDNMLYMQSTNANDGTQQLTVTTDVDTNVNTDQVNVQNRAAQAQPNCHRRQSVRHVHPEVYGTSDVRLLDLLAE